MRHQVWTVTLVCGVELMSNACDRVSTPPRHAEMATRTDTSALQEGPLQSNLPSGALAATGAPGETTATPLSDAQIAGITDAANSTEVEQARIAEAKAKNSNVKGFADMMILHHQAAETEQAGLGILTVRSPIGDRLRAQAAETLNRLNEAVGDFDRVYIDSQVEEHRKLLELITTQLLPNVKDAKLKAYIEDFKVKAEIHLQRAEAERLRLSALANEVSDV